MIRILIILLLFSSTAFGQRQFFALGKPATLRVPFDTDAQIYINAVEAAGRTLTPEEEERINTFFVTAKARTYWAKIADGFFPIWGTSAPSLITWKVATTLTAIASPTFSSSGVDFNGTTQYITTNYSAVSNTTSHLSYYSQDDVTGAYNDIGSSTGTNRYQLLILLTTTGQVGRIYTSGNQTASARGGGSAGFAITSRTASNDHRSYWNGAQTGSTVTASGGTRPTHAIYIGAENDDGTAVNFSPRKCSAATWGTGLTVSEAADLTTDIETFLDSMGIGIIP